MVAMNFVRRELLFRAAPALLSATLCVGFATADEPRSKAPSSAKDEHDHEHPTEGPNHGELIELGKEEYHAELVHGKEGKITIFLLDHDVKKYVLTDAKQVVINLAHKGKAEQYKLPAAPVKGDPAGMTSRFILTDKHLAEDLEDPETTARITVSINGKQYSSKIVHNHDHDDHKH